MNASDLLTRIPPRHGRAVSGYIAEIERARPVPATGRSCCDAQVSWGLQLYGLSRDTRSRTGSLPGPSRLILGPSRSLSRPCIGDLDTYAPGREDLKNYIVGISLYLTFIAQDRFILRECRSPKRSVLNRRENFFTVREKRRFLERPPHPAVASVCADRR